MKLISNLNFQVHKELYCSSRHHHQSIDSGVSLSSGSSATPSTSTTASENSFNSNRAASITPTGHHHRNHHTEMAYGSSNLSNVNDGSSNSKSSSLANSLASSSGIGSSSPQSSFSSSPNSVTNSILITNKKRVSQTELQNYSSDANETNRTEANVHNAADLLLNECDPIKYTDFRSLFPCLTNDPISSQLRSATTLGSESNESSAQSAVAPIYIVISTDPLILVPFIFNPIINSFEPSPKFVADLEPNILNNIQSLTPNINSTLIFPNNSRLFPSSVPSDIFQQSLLTTLEEMRKQDHHNNDLLSLSHSKERNFLREKNTNHQNFGKNYFLLLK